MKRSPWLLPALASGLAVLVWGDAAATHDAASGGARPRYGGVLRVETSASLASVDPAVLAGARGDDAEETAVLSLLFEPLARVEASGTLTPLVAESWTHDERKERWRFRLRRDVMLHDGTRLTAGQVAASLRESEPGRTVQAQDDVVIVECDRPEPDLVWELASMRHAVRVAGPSGLRIGTGPFKVERVEPGRRLVLTAHEGHWAGRPFLDGVRIEMGRSRRDQAVSLEGGRTDLASLLPQDVRRLAQRGFRVASSPPRELLALAFDARLLAAERERTRVALALAIDRAAIGIVLLQRHGEPAASLLPGTLSGYSSAFSLVHDRAGARRVSRAAPEGPLTLCYPAGDDLAQSIAERIVVDAREAGLVLKPEAEVAIGGRAADMRVRRVAFEPASPGLALERLLAALDLPAAFRPEETPSTVEAAFDLEQRVLARHLVVPIAHLPVIHGLAQSVRWTGGPLVLPGGTLRLADVWLVTEKP